MVMNSWLAAIGENPIDAPARPSTWPATAPMANARAAEDPSAAGVIGDPHWYRGLRALATLGIPPANGEYQDRIAGRPR
jgi:hypothetical protein